jgi:DNA-binding transcriptional MerR regulator
MIAAMGDAWLSYTAGDAARITGVPYRTIDHWARTKFIAPSVAEAQGTGTERLYSFKDLVALRVARELRDAGIATSALRRVIEALTEKDFENPLAEAKLVAIGRDVVIVSGEAELISILRSPGQTYLAFVLDLGAAVAEVRQGAGEGLRESPEAPRKKPVVAASESIHSPTATPRRA